MYSPTKESNDKVRMNNSKNKYIIKGRRKIKSKEEISNYKFSISK